MRRGSTRAATGSTLLALAAALGGLAWLACTPDAPEPAPVPPLRFHLASQLNTATVVAPTAPDSTPLDWQGRDLETTWTLLGSESVPHFATLAPTFTDEGVDLDFGVPAQPRGPLRVGGLRIDLEASDFGRWDTVLVEARSSDRFAGVTVAVNVDDDEALPGFMRFFASTGNCPPIFNDGSIQTYAIPISLAEKQTRPDQLKSLAVLFAAPGEATIQVRSVRLVPHGASYPEEAGVLRTERGGTTREALYLRTPGEISLEVPAMGESRLDFGLTAEVDRPVTYRLLRRFGDSEEVLFERTVEAAESWEQFSQPLNLNEPTQLVLAAEAAEPGTVALWGSPVVSSTPPPGGPPNVIFYVIDGGDANLMSLYEYGRPTTPYLESLANEGVLFGRAYSNATWTQPSTVSFLTSLQHSVLGGLRRGIHSTPVPTAAVTMAEHFRQGGYTTASFTANPNAGRMVGTDRGVDWMRDAATENHSTSSLTLHEEFWKYRDAYPQGPFFVHFQTTDVHEPNHPEEPFAGTFVGAEQLAEFEEWDNRLWGAVFPWFGRTSVVDLYDRGIEASGVDRYAYFAVRNGLYDETMLHQDHALEQFVQELRDRGEWENTILVIGADHGHPAGTFARFGRGLLDPQPEPWQGALADAYATRVPFLVVWPGQLEGGRRIDRPVSMLDVLPTVLELAGLPEPEVLQGQSLAPLLRGGEIEARPVILDEFRVDETSGELIGNLEIIDGRWAASLEIGPTPEETAPGFGRYQVPAGGRWGAVHPFFPDVPRLLLYDLEEDPFTTRAVNEEHPDLVRKYTRLLQEHWQAHQALATRFSEAGEVTLDPEQLEQLKALGYIQ